MHPKLTPKQKEFMAYLETQTDLTGQSPSLRQAASDNGVSHAACAQMIRALEEKGVIRRDGRYSRTIHILHRSGSSGSMTVHGRMVPVIGTIAAGLPLYAQQEWDDMLVVDPNVYGTSPLFALKIKGDSMKNAAILNGDIVICEPRQFAENGEIVAALIHQEEATVKRFFQRKKHIELRPENPDYSPMIYSFSDILIQGKVIGIHRGPDVAAKL